MKLVVVDKSQLATDVVRVALASVDGEPLRPFSPGSHISVRLGAIERRYSLTSTDAGQYEICVQRAKPSRGGSDYVHDTLMQGSTIEVEGPFNGFPMQSGASHSVLIAGGIGVTPFFTMAHELLSQGSSFEVHYAVRSRDRLLPVERLGDRLATYVEDEGSTINIEQVLAAAPSGSTFYACGPHGMLEAIRLAAGARGIPSASVRMESFGATKKASDSPVDVYLSLSDTRFRVEPGQSILSAALEAGAWATHECNRGECGSCYVRVLGGTVEHRDVCLTSEQRAQGMCTCVSWAKSPGLILEL